MVAPNDKFSFTKQSLETVPVPPDGKRYSFKDSRERGLILRVTAKGNKTFQLYQKHEGRPVRVTLGSFPDMTVERARKAAIRAKLDLSEGRNPNIEKRRIRDETTLGQLFEEYMERYSKVEKKSWKYDEREIPKFLSHWFNRKISAISKHEITKLHERIRKNNGLYQANRLLERLRAMYNKAITWGWDGQNPTKGIKKFREESRDRYAVPAEMPYLLRAIEEEENEVAHDYITFSLLSGARKTNVLQMRWEEVDWHNETWRIPDSKNGEPLLIPLTAQAISLLERRRKAVPDSPWVFPSEISRTGHLRDPKKAWTRIKQRATLAIWTKTPALADLIAEAEKTVPENSGLLRLFKEIEARAKKQKIELPTGLMDLRLHDIRRTFGSYQAITGASLKIIGESLGHKSQKATEIYSRLHNDPVRDSMHKATEAMFALAEEDYTKERK